MWKWNMKRNSLYEKHKHSGRDCLFYTAGDHVVDSCKIVRDVGALYRFFKTCTKSLHKSNNTDTGIDNYYAVQVLPVAECPSRLHCFTCDKHHSF